MDWKLRIEVRNFLKDSRQLPQDGDGVDEDVLLHHSVFVDCINLLDISPSLVEFFLEDGDCGSWLLKEVVQDYVREEFGKFVQVSVQVLFVNVPRCLPEHNVKSFFDLPSQWRTSQPFAFSGALVAQSAMVQYKKSARFWCVNKNCAGAKSFVDMPNPEMAKDSAKRCTFCQKSMVEKVGHRSVSYYVTAIFIPVEPQKERKRCQGIHFVVKDEWIDCLQLGKRYEMTAKCICPANEEMASFFQCLCLTPLPHPITRLMANKQLVEMPQAIVNLHRETDASPWCFAMALAFLFAEQVAPRGSFHQLKLAILLSLASTKFSSQEMTALPILVSTPDDSEYPHRLLSYGLGCTDVPVVHNLQSSLCSNQTRKEFVEAGSLLRAENSVCYLGHVLKYKKDTLHTLQSVLESGSIPVEMVDNKKNATTLSYPLETTVWTYGCSKKLGKSSTNQHGEFCATLKPLIDVFGTVFCCSEKGAEGILAYHALQGMHENTYLNQKYLKQFLMQCRELQPSMDAEATCLIKKYFVASRRARLNDSASHGNEFPQTGLKIMTNMATAHAKLSLRGSCVTVYDAVAAIRLYEENVVAQCGVSHLDVTTATNHHMPANFGEPDIRRQYDADMEKFHTKLISFVDNYVGDLSISLDIEE